LKIALIILNFIKLELLFILKLFDYFRIISLVDL